MAKRLKGPKGNLLFGAGLLYNKDPLAFLTETAAEYPDFATFRFGPLRVHLLSHPEYIQHVLQKNHKNYKKGALTGEMRNFLGNSMVVADGEDWRKKRKTSQPAFGKKKIDEMCKEMISCTNTFIEKWKTNVDEKPMEMVGEMKQLALRIIGRTLFNTEFPNNFQQLSSSMNHIFSHADSRFQKMYNPPLWFPFGGRKKVLKEKKYIEESILEMLKQRKETKKEFTDLFSMLMDAHSTTGNDYSEKEIIDEITLMFFAGSESSALTLAMAFYLLSQNKTVEEKLRKEIKEVVSKDKLSVKHLSQLTYTKSIIEETLRLYPPFWLLARQAINDDSIDGHTIKKGDGIFISPYVMHKSERFWKNPERFDPDRFDRDKKGNADTYVYIPFGKGPRGCMGYHFAMVEMQIVLALIYQNFTFTYEGDGNLNIIAGINLRPNGGMPMKPIPLS